MDREQRRGFNEVVFREVNERVREVSEAFAVTEDVLPLVCECSDPTCTQTIELEPARYERLRSDATRFVVAAGHEALDVEEVVERIGAYGVVRKNPGLSATLAEESNPRG